MSATATATAVRFQVSLNVTNIDRSVRFYRALLAVEPSLNGSHQIRFELEDPPVVLNLVPAAHVAVGSLNHVGLRLPDSESLVAIQRRMEEAGIATQRQEGVECCYARQTKFWVTDPDRNLWELYVLHEDIDHSGFEDAAHPEVKPAALVWEHRLTAPVPRIPHDDASVDEVRLEGSYNARLDALRPAAFLAEVFRVLRPGSKVVVHGMVGDRTLESPSLPGLAAMVQRVPTADEPLEALRKAGFGGLFFENLKPITCLQVGGVALSEMQLVGWRPDKGLPLCNRRVLYKGPLANVAGEDGTVYPRGTTVTVPETAWQLLREGPAAGQFLFYPD